MENPSNIIPDQLIVLEGDAGLVPKASSGDVGKVLGVLNSSGDVGWVPDQEGMAQVQADWDQTDSSQVSYIANKPDLSVYATTSAMNTALAGKQDNISDLATIRSGAEAGATAVQPAALNDYATTSAMNTALAGKQDVISDLADIRAGAAKGDTAVQPSALDSYATTSAMNTALAGKQDVISDLSDIRAGAALGATAAQPSDLPSSDELVPSATSGDEGKVLTVDSQGNPSWVTPSAGTVYTAGDGIDITSNVISADVDGTTIGIDASTKKIKSLQTIPSVDQTYNASSTNAQSGTAVAGALATVKQVPSSTSSDENKVLTVNSSGNAVWAASSVPASKPLVAGANITITDGANDVTIAATDTTYTAGDGVDITSNVISADVDGTTIGIDSTTKKIKSLQVIPTKTSDLQNDSNFVVSSSLATVATSGSYADLSNKPTIPSVDQTYSAVSTNAQSGVAVAQAIAAIPSSSYTAGDAIDITSNEISVDYDTNTLDVVGQTVTENVTQKSSSGLFLLPSSVAALLSQQDDTQVTVHIPANTLKDENFLIDSVGEVTYRITLYATDATSESSVSLFSTPIEYTLDIDHAVLTEQDIVFNLPASVANQWSQNLSSAVAFNICGQRYSTPATQATLTVIGNLTTSPIIFTFVDDSIQKLAVKNPIPASVQADSGKVLKVNASGNVEWGADSDTTYTAGNMISIDAGRNNAIDVRTTAGITDIQQVAALPASPVATVLYLIPST